MGWGFMAGMSKGLGAYGATLERKNVEEWKTQQDDLAYKRQQGLENLRAQNNRTAAEEGRKFQTSERQAGQTFTEGQNKSLWDRQDKAKVEERKYQQDVQANQNAFTLERDKATRSDAQADWEFRLGKTNEANREATENAIAFKKQQYENAVADGSVDDTPRNRASFVYGIKPEKLKKPSDKHFQIALDTLQLNEGFLKAKPQEQEAAINAMAWGFASDPGKMKRNLRDVSSDAGKFDPAKDVPKLVSKAKKGGKAWDDAADKLRAAVSEKEYNDIMLIVNKKAGINNDAVIQPQPLGAMASMEENLSGTGSTSKAAFKKEVDTSNMTKFAEDAFYKKWKESKK